MRLRAPGRALGALACLLSLIWAGSADGAESSTLATGEAVQGGVSSVAWAIGILDPNLRLTSPGGTGGPGTTAALTVPATGAPAPPKPKPSHASRHVLEPAPSRSAPGTLPPASAGTNGTSIAPVDRQMELASRDSLGYGSAGGGGPMTTLLGGIALAPASAPPPIQAAVDAANSISTTPYVWGGGHASFSAPGYDCSGAVSFALHGAGFLSQPLASGQLMHWGAPGPGKWLTVFASPSHAYAVIAGLRWDTVGDEHGSGPRWHPEGPYPTGFAVRHFPGY